MSAITIDYAPFLGHEASSSYHPPGLTSTTCSTTTNSTPFVPSHTLQIQTPAIGCFRLPLPPRALETRIFSASGTLAYTSASESRWKGNCTLQRVTNDAKGMEDVATTEYSFGCFRDPVVRLGDGDAKDDEREEIVIKRKGMWTRSVGFESSGQGRFFEWRYGTKSERAVAGKDVDFLLILEKTTTNSEKEEEEKIKIAQLIRGKETRTPGSNKTSAGNGGLLEMNLGCDGAFEEEEAEQVDEGLIVATCLVMLR